MTIRVFIVDDEQPARRKLRRFLSGDAETIVVGEAASGEEAVPAIRESAPDLVFLDVQMKGMDGFDVVRALDAGTLPRIVFVTAHDQYAMQAFDVHAFGYLLKPFDRPRFEKVLAHAKREFAGRENRNGDLARLLAEIDRRRNVPRRILVEHDERAAFVAIDTIDWLEAERNYVRLHVGDAVHTVRGTLDSLRESLDATQFVQLNRSAIVRVDFIREMKKWFHGEYKVVLRSGVTMMWTRRYRR